MDKKLPELKAEAKRLGLKRYSRLKKAELINLLTRNSSPILDEEIPEIDSEILKPTKYIKPRIDEDEAKKRKREIRKGHAHAVGVQSRYKICNAKLGAVACDPKMAGVCWKRKWKVQLMCIYMILTKTLSIPLF